MNNNTNAGAHCVGCNGGNLRCLNANSPCFMYFCGEYPGTGPRPKEEKGSDKPKSR